MTGPTSRLVLVLVAIGFGVVGLALAVAGVAALLSPSLGAAIGPTAQTSVGCSGAVIGLVLAALATWAGLGELGLGRAREE